MNTPNNVFEKKPCQHPLVSVIIPAYNAEDYIAETLQSVLNQTYKNLEIIVIDDGSKDRTSSIVNEFANRDSRIILIPQANAGVVVSRNKGIQISKGELIAPLDSDDIWMPENLEKQVCSMLKAESSVGVVYSWSFDIDEQSYPTGHFHAFTIEGNVYSTLLCHFFLSNASCTLIRKECLEHVGLYRTQKDLLQGCEDWDIYLRLAEAYQFKAVSDFLVGYRKRLNSMTNNSEAMARFLGYIWESILNKYPKIPKRIYKISTSSFFLYLSWQNSLLGEHQQSLFWLRQAASMSLFVVFSRPASYKILAGSFLSHFRMTSSFSQGTSDKNAHLNRIKKQESTYFNELSRISFLNSRGWLFRMKIQTQNWMGNLLHWYMRSFFGKPQDWEY